MDRQLQQGIAVVPQLSQMSSILILNSLNCPALITNIQRSFSNNIPQETWNETPSKNFYELIYKGSSYWSRDKVVKWWWRLTSHLKVKGLKCRLCDCVVYKSNKFDRTLLLLSCINRHQPSDGLVSYPKGEGRGERKGGNRVKVT